MSQTYNTGGGGGGTPIQILFKILGIDEAKAAVAGIAPEFDKILQAASKTGEAVTKALPDASKITPAKTALEQLKVAEEGVGTAATKTATEIDKAKVSTEGLATSGQKAVTELDKEKTAMTGIATETGKVVTETDKLKTSQTGLVTETTKIVTETEKLKTTQTGLVTETGKATTGLEKEKKAIADVSKETGRTATETDKLKKSTGELAKETDKVDREVKESTKAVKDYGDESKKTGEKIKDTTEKTKEVATTTTSLKSSFVGIAGSVTTLGTSLVTLWSTYDSIGDAQLRVSQQTATLETANIKLANIERQLNKLRQEGKTGTEDYNILLQKQETQILKIANAEGQLANSQEDLNTTMANAAMTVIPQLVGMGGALAGVYATVTNALEKLRIKKAEATVTTANLSKGMTGAATATGLFGKALNFVKLNPILIPLTLISAALTAFATNALGFRDALNGIGVAIGNAIGPLKPFLVMLGDLGQGLVEFLGMGSEETEVFAETVDESMDEAGESVKSMSPVLSTFSGDIKNALGTSSQEAAESLEQNVKWGADESIKHLQTLLDESYKTAAEMKKVFSESVTLDSITLSGLQPGKFTQPQPLGGMGTLTNKPAYQDLAVEFKNAPRGPSQQLLKDMIVLTDQFGKVHTSVDQYNKIITEAGFKGEQLARVKKLLQHELGIFIHYIDDSVDGSNELTKTADTLKLSLTGEAEAIDKTSTSLTKNTDSTKKGAEATTELAETFNAAGISSTTLEAAMTRLSSSNQTLIEDYSYYNAIANDVGLQQEVIAQGVLKQNLAMRQQQVTTLETVAMLVRYNEQLDTTEGKLTAQNAGKAKQLDAFVKEKVAVQENIGVYDLLKKQLAEGEIQTVAFEKAFGDMLITIANGQLEVYKLRGETAALAASMELGEVQTIEFNKSLEQTKRMILDTELALSSADGKFVALMQSIRSGELALIDYATGQRAMRDEIVESYRELDRSTGSLNEYISFLDAGIIQHNAYTKAIIDTTKANAQLRETNAGLIGQYETIIQGLTDQTAIIDKNNNAYLTSAVSVAQWGETLKTTQSSMEGTYAALADVARAAGVIIPEGFEGGEEAIKQFISYSAGAGAEFEELMKGMKSDFESMTSGLGGAMRKSNKDLGDAIDEMEEKLGVQFDEGIRNALKLEAGADAIVSLGKDLTTLVSEIKLSPNSFSKLKTQFMGQIAETLDDIPEEVRPEATKIVNELMAALNAPVDLDDPESIRQWIGDVNALLVKLDNVGSATSTSFSSSMGVMNNQKLDAVKGEFTSLNNEAQALIKSLDAVGASYGVITDQTGKTQVLQMEDYDPRTGKTTMTEVPTATAAPDTSGIDAAHQKLNTFNLAVAQIPTTVNTAVTAANVEFALLNPIQETFATNMTTLTTNLGLLSEGVNQEVTAANIEFDKLNPVGPTFATIMQTLVANLGLLSEGVAQEVLAANAEFDKLNPVGPTFATIMQTMVANIGLLSEGVAQEVIATNLEFDKLGTTLPTVALPAINNFVTSVQTGPFSTLQINAGNTAKAVSNIFDTESKKIKSSYDSAMRDVELGPFRKVQTDAATAARAVVNIFKTEAPKIATAFNSAIATIKEEFNGMQSSVVRNLDAVNDAAWRASQSVDNLTDSARALKVSIDSLQNKEIVITTRYETVGTPVFGATGFGPAVIDHPTKLTVGESGPEYVSVIPLSTAGGKNLTPDERLSLYGDPTKTRTYNMPVEQEAIFLAAGIGTATAAGGTPITQSGSFDNNTLVSTRLVAIGGISVNGAIPVNIIGSSIPLGGGAGSGQTGTGGGMPSSTIGQGSFGGGSNQTNTGTNNYNNQNDVNNQSNTSTNGQIGGGTTIGSKYQRPNQIHRIDNEQAGQPNTFVVWRSKDTGKVVATTEYYEDGSARSVFYDENENVKGHSNDAVDLSYMPNYDVETYKVSGQTGTGTTTGTGSTTGTSGNGGYPAGYTPPEGIQVTGTGKKWAGHDPNPNNWKTVRMNDDPNLWKVVDGNDRNVAARFQSQAEAEEYIQAWRNDYNSRQSGTTTPGSTTGGNETGVTVSPAAGIATPRTSPDNKVYITEDDEGVSVDEWNMLSDSRKRDLVNQHGGIYSVPAGHTVNEDLSISRTSGTTTGTGTGTPTSASEFSHVQTHGGSKWTTDPQGPYEIVPMQDDPSKYKIIDSTGKNVAANFNSEEEAERYLQHYGNTLPGYTGPVSGSGPPAGGVTSPTTGTGGTTPDFSHVKTSGTGSKWAKPGEEGDPSTWESVPMTDPGKEGKYKLVNKEGKNVAADFNSELEADQYQQYRVSGNTGGTTGSGNGTTTGGGTTVSPDDDPNNPHNWSVTTGMGGSKVKRPDGTVIRTFDTHDEAVDWWHEQEAAYDAQQAGTGNGTTTGTGGTTTTGGYTTPAHVKTSGSSKKWGNHNPNPNTWKVVPMTDRDKKHLWKVVDNNDINVAAEFVSEAEAQEYIDAHNNLPTPSNGGTNTGTGTTAPTGGTTTTGGTTGTGTQTHDQSGSGYYYQSQNGVVNTNMPKEMQAALGLPVVEPNGSAPAGGSGGQGGNITIPHILYPIIDRPNPGFPSGQLGGYAPRNQGVAGIENGGDPLVQSWGSGGMPWWAAGNGYPGTTAPGSSNTGSSTSTSRQWTDERGNNYNYQSDVNTRSNVSGNGAVAGGITPTTTNNGNAVVPTTQVGTMPTSGSNNSGQNLYWQSQNGVVNTNMDGSGGASNTGSTVPAGSSATIDPNGVINQGGTIVDGQNGRVVMNGMIVDGKTGTVVMTQTNNQTGNGGQTGALPPGAATGLYPSIPIAIDYPRRALKGDITEPTHQWWRSGQDLSAPFYDTGDEDLTQTALGGRLIRPGMAGGAGTGGGNIGGGIGIPSIGEIMDWVRDMINSVFSMTTLQINNTNFIDTDKVYESQKKQFGLRLGTVLK